MGFQSSLPTKQLFINYDLLKYYFLHETLCPYTPILPMHLLSKTLIPNQCHSLPLELLRPVNCTQLKKIGESRHNYMIITVSWVSTIAPIPVFSIFNLSAPSFALNDYFKYNYFSPFLHSTAWSLISQETTLTHSKPRKQTLEQQPHVQPTSPLPTLPF